MGEAAHVELWARARMRHRRLALSDVASGSAEASAPVHHRGAITINSVSRKSGRNSQAPYFMHYNFVRIHKPLRVTPAMEPGISDHLCSLEEIARPAG